MPSYPVVQQQLSGCRVHISEQSRSDADPRREYVQQPLYGTANVIHNLRAPLTFLFGEEQSPMSRKRYLETSCLLKSSGTKVLRVGCERKVYLY